MSLIMDIYGLSAKLLVLFLHHKSLREEFLCSKRGQVDKWTYLTGEAPPCGVSVGALGSLLGTRVLLVPRSGDVGM